MLATSSGHEEVSPAADAAANLGLRFAGLAGGDEALTKSLLRTSGMIAKQPPRAIAAIIGAATTEMHARWA